MPFIMSNMVRFAINGRWTNGRPVVNILDMSVIRNPDAPGVPWIPSERAEIIRLKAQDVADAWASNLLPNMTTAYTLENVSWTDLDSVNGSTGSAPPSSGSQSGALGADSAPPQTTLLVTKVEGGRNRGTRPGRWYLSAVRDSDIDNNGLVLATWRTQMNNALEQFRQDVEDQEILDDAWGVPVVIHEAAGTAGEITSFDVSQKVGKQGRRYDGRA